MSDSMLVLHCGWPRTGTTSLQTALFGQRARLARAGVIYPDRWLGGETKPAHHGFGQLLEASLSFEQALDDFMRFLAANKGRRVLLSHEGIAEMLPFAEKVDALAGFIAAAREIMPVRCVWTLRRLDDVVASAYLLMLKLGWASSLPDPDQYMARRVSPDPLFAGMRRMGEVVDDVVYLKYDGAGAHHGELLRAFEIPEDLGERIRMELDLGPHRNTSPSHKEAVALVHWDVLSERVGFELDTTAMLSAFKRADFRFQGDHPCELVDLDARREMHQRVLRSAQDHGFDPYIEFFAQADVQGSPLVGLDPEILTAEDLRYLVEHLAATAPAHPEEPTRSA